MIKLVDSLNNLIENIKSAPIISTILIILTIIGALVYGLLKYKTEVKDLLNLPIKFAKHPAKKNKRYLLDNVYLPLYQTLYFINISDLTYEQATTLCEELYCIISDNLLYCPSTLNHLIYKLQQILKNYEINPQYHPKKASDDTYKTILQRLSNYTIHEYNRLRKSLGYTESGLLDTFHYEFSMKEACIYTSFIWGTVIYTGFAMGLIFFSIFPNNLILFTLAFLILLGGFFALIINLVCYLITACIMKKYRKDESKDIISIKLQPKDLKKSEDNINPIPECQIDDKQN